MYVSLLKKVQKHLHRSHASWWPDTLRKLCGTLEAPLISEATVGSIASSATPAVQGCPNSLDLTSPSLQLLTLHQQFQDQKRRMNRAACSHFRERCFLCITVLMQSQATSQTAFKEVSGRVSPELYQDGYFSCSAVSEARNWVPSEGNGAPLTICCSSHNSSHCLKWSCTSALFCQGRN